MQMWIKMHAINTYRDYLSATGPNSRQFLLLPAMERAVAPGARTVAAIPAKPRNALALEGEVALAIAADASLSRELRPAAA